MVSKHNMLTSPFLLLSNSLRVYKENFWTYLGYSAWLLLPMAAFLALDAVRYFWLEQILAIVITIIQILISLWVVVCLLKLTYGILTEKTVSSQTLSRDSVSRVPFLLATALLQSVIVLGGILLFVVPGFVFWVWYAFAQLSSVLDGSRPVESLTISREMVRGRFFPVLTRLLFGPILISIIYLAAVSTIYTSVSLSIGADPKSLLSDDLPAWIIALDGITEVIIFPLLLIYCVNLFHDLKKNPIKIEGSTIL
jgi:hypothetical protein